MKKLSISIISALCLFISTNAAQSQQKQSKTSNKSTYTLKITNNASYPIDIAIKTVFKGTDNNGTETMKHYDRNFNLNTKQIITADFEHNIQNITVTNNKKNISAKNNHEFADKFRPKTMKISDNGKGKPVISVK